jgi:hypothetical protein
MCAGFVRDGMGEEGFYPGFGVGEFDFDLVTGRHGEKIADTHGFEILGRLCGSVVREKLEDGIVNAEFSFRDGEADGSGSEALAEGMEHVGFVGRFGFPPTFGDDMAVADEHEAVHFTDLLVGSFDEVADDLGRDALEFRGAARKVLRGR